MAQRHIVLMGGLLASASAASVVIEAWVEYVAQAGCTDSGTVEWFMKFDIGDSVNSSTYPSCSYPCTQWSSDNSYTKHGKWCQRNVDPSATQVWVYLKGEEHDAGTKDCDHFTSSIVSDSCRTETTCHFDL
eukprot:Hpha_TRINITY_DN16073_c6_g1::TRINITY_DN16073_c6_g1_i1::g.122264::m.122264